MNTSKSKMDDLELQPYGSAESLSSSSNHQSSRIDDSMSASLDCQPTLSGGSLSKPLDNKTHGAVANSTSGVLDIQAYGTGELPSSNSLDYQQPKIDLSTSMDCQTHQIDHLASGIRQSCQVADLSDINSITQTSGTAKSSSTSSLDQQKSNFQDSATSIDGQPHQIDHLASGFLNRKSCGIAGFSDRTSNNKCYGIPDSSPRTSNTQIAGTADDASSWSFISLDNENSLHLPQPEDNHNYSSTADLLNSTNAEATNAELATNAEAANADATNADATNADATNADATTPETTEEREVVIEQSKWHLGRKTMASMILSYLLAFVCAALHLVFFIILNGKRVGNTEGMSDIDQMIAQNYVTAISVIFAGCFTALLHISVSTAYTQHLWHLFRKSLFEIRAIEELSTMPLSPLKLTKNIFVHVKHAPFLVLMTIFLFLYPLGASFPSGALNIISISPDSTVTRMILSYNATDIGNGTVADAFAKSLASIGPYEGSLTGNDTNWTMQWLATFPTDPPPLAKLAAATTFAGRPLPVDSPCGPNCTYTYDFEGPSFNCSSIVASETKIFDLSRSSNHPSMHLIYGGVWVYFDGNPDPLASTNPIPQGVQPTLNLTVSNILDIPIPPGDVNTNSANLTVMETKLICIPYRSSYNVTNSYTNGVHNLTYSTSQIERLPRLEGLQNSMNVSFSGNFAENSHDQLQQIDWNEDLLLWWRNCQMMAIVTGIGKIFSGAILSAAETGKTNDTNNLTYGYWSSAKLQVNGTGGSLIPYTAINEEFHHWDVSDIKNMNDVPVNFIVSEEIVNKILGDYVISLAPAFGDWKQMSKVTLFPSHNVYSFSNKKQFFIPYGLCLGLALPFVVLGIWALYRNGVPATDGGIIQMLTTTTGSEELRAAAAGHCLGGDIDLPENLMNMKVKYGELPALQIDANGGLVRRAGFGTEDEVMPLVKGETYGAIRK